ncbi:MAG TPA: hypothetical protein VK254_02420 [Candidatus Bathyarchaeia archaeon]|nr:hypothetical protein [Candidatus Bathyarchaeia archaeon]
MSEQPIEILGEKIDPEKMPVLHQWAKTNPKGLEKTLLRMSNKSRVSVASEMANLESDMQTDND